MGANGYGRARAVFDEWQVRAWANVFHTSCSAVDGNGYLSYNGRHIAFNLNMVESILFNQKVRRYFGISHLQSPLGYKFEALPDLVPDPKTAWYTARQQLMSTAESFAEKSLTLYDIVAVATITGPVSHSLEDLLSVAQSKSPS